MTQKTNDWKIGIFVLVGLLLLLGALFVFGASKWFEGKTVEETYVAGNVDGLKVGSQVTLRGVPVGEVTRINFTWNVYHKPEPRYVYVEFEVHDKVSLAPPGKRYAALVQEQIEKGLRARVKSQGLAGNTILSLEYVNPKEYPPLSVPWTPRHVYIPAAPGELSEIISALGKVTANLKQVDFQALGRVLQQDLTRGGKVLDQAGRANMGGIGTNLDGLVSDLRAVAGQLHAYVGDTNLMARANLERISTQAGQLLVQLKAVTERLQGTLANLDTGALNETLQNLQSVSEHLDETITEIKAYPAGALLGKPPPPAQSVEPPGR